MKMEEEKRRILTKEGVRRQQLHSMKGDLIFGLPLFLVVEAMLIAVTCGAYRAAAHMWMPTLKALWRSMKKAIPSCLKRTAN